MPVSNTKQFTARRSPAKAAETQLYEIIAPDHKPDLRASSPFEGQFYYEGGKQYVRLTEAQARYYVDMGALQLVEKPTAP